MKDKKTNKNRLRWLLLIISSIAARIGFILLTFPYMWIYSHWINYGHGADYYKEYFFQNRAWISTGLGIPVFFFIGWWLAKKTSYRINEHIFWFWVFYTLGDIPIELFGGDLDNFWQQLIVAHITKLGALFIGAYVAIRKLQE